MFIPPLNVIKREVMLAKLVKASALQADVHRFSGIIGSGQKVNLVISF